jgi:hypothetical protein
MIVPTRGRLIVPGTIVVAGGTIFNLRTAQPAAHDPGSIRHASGYPLIRRPAVAAHPRRRYRSPSRLAGVPRAGRAVRKQARSVVGRTVHAVSKVTAVARGRLGTCGLLPAAGHYTSRSRLANAVGLRYQTVMFCRLDAGVLIEAHWRGIPVWLVVFRWGSCQNGA